MTRRPLSFVYGNCLLGACGAWAVFACEPYSYAALTAERKRERFGAMLAAIESLEADIQILRLARAWDANSAFASLAGGLLRSAHETRTTLTSTAQLEALEVELRGGCPPSISPSASSRPSATSPPFSVNSASRSPREVWSSVRDAFRLAGPGHLSAVELERLRGRADEMHARIEPSIPVRPARTLEVQWLVRRAFCRGLGEPEVDGLHEPQALVFERNGDAVLAPLEADVMRWSESYVEQRGASTRGRVRARHELAGASRRRERCPRSPPFPSSRLELMFAPAESLPFGIDLTLSARATSPTISRSGWCDAAFRTPTRSCAPRRRATRASPIAATAARRTRATCSSYLQSASHPPLLRPTLAVAVAGRDEDGARAARRGCSPRVRRGAPAPPARRPAAALRRRAARAARDGQPATTTCSPPSRWPR